MARLEIETPGDDAYHELSDRLVAFNQANAAWQMDAFTATLRDEDGALRGRAHAFVRMGAVEIRVLWLDEALHGRGFGREIVHAVEHEARKRGACAALLDTYEFQAREFYESLGYTCFGTFDYLGGVKCFYLSRRL